MNIRETGHRVKYDTLPDGSVVKYLNTICMKIGSTLIDLENGCYTAISNTDIIVDYYPDATLFLGGKE